MAPKTNPLLVLLVDVLAIASPLLSPASAAEDKPKKITMPLKDICNLTISEDNPKPIDEFCMSAIQSVDDDHHDINDMDVVTALRLSMKAFFAYAKPTADHVKQLQDDPKYVRFRDQTLLKEVPRELRFRHRPYENVKGADEGDVEFNIVRFQRSLNSCWGL